MKKQLSILLLIFAFTMSASAQSFKLSRKGNIWSRGEILTINGTKKGMLKAPLHVDSKTVSFKSSKDAEEEEIDKSIITEVRILNSKGEFTILENIKVNRYLGKYSKDRIKLSKKSYFVLKLAEGYYSAYVVPSGDGYYKVNENGFITVFTSGNIQMGDVSFDYYIKKQGDDYLNHVYNSSFFNAQKSKGIKAWLGDSKAVMEKLEDRRFLKNSSIEAWVNLYNQDKQK